MDFGYIVFVRGLGLVSGYVASQYINNIVANSNMKLSFLLFLYSIGAILLSHINIFEEWYLAMLLNGFVGAQV